MAFAGSSFETAESHHATRRRGYQHKSMIGPILGIELLTAARRTRYFIIRACYVAALGLALWYSYRWSLYGATSPSIGAMAQFAEWFFQTFSTLQILAVVCFGPAIVASSIALERERRTIEYLFATDLTNLEIVFGKLFARLLQLGVYVLAGVPVLAISGLLGGIDLVLVVVLTVVTLFTALSVACGSIFISVWTLRARDAITRTYFLVLAALTIPLWLYGMLGWRLSRWQWAFDWLLSYHPLYVLEKLWYARSSRIPWEYLASFVALNLLFSLFCLLLAVVAVRRVHLRTSGAATARRWRLRWRRRPPVGTHAMWWKELHTVAGRTQLGFLGRLAAVLLVIAVVAMPLWEFAAFLLDARGMLGTPTSYDNLVRELAGYNVFLTGALGCGGLLLVAARAATSITSEKERLTWSEILSTTLSASEIVAAKAAGSLRAGRLCVLVIGGFWLLMVLFDPEFLLFVPLGVVSLVVLGLFASLLGTFISLRSNSSVRALGATLAIGIFLGGGYLFCCLPVAFDSGDEARFLVAGFVPFLLAFPAVAYSIQSWQGDVGDMAQVFALGLIGYAIAVLLLWQFCVSGFDELSGRTVAPLVGRARMARNSSGSPSPPTDSGSEVIPAPTVASGDTAPPATPS